MYVEGAKMAPKLTSEDSCGTSFDLFITRVGFIFVEVGRIGGGEKDGKKESADDAHLVAAHVVEGKLACGGTRSYCTCCKHDKEQNTRKE